MESLPLAQYLYPVAAPAAASSETEEERKTLTFEELEEGEFLKRVCLLLLDVRFGLDVVCTVLDKYGHRTSDGKFSLQLLLLLEESDVRKVYIHLTDTWTLVTADSEINHCSAAEVSGGKTCK